MYGCCCVGTVAGAWCPDLACPHSRGAGGDARGGVHRGDVCVVPCASPTRRTYSLVHIFFSIMIATTPERSMLLTLYSQNANRVHTSLQAPRRGTLGVTRAGCGVTRHGSCPLRQSPHQSSVSLLPALTPLYQRGPRPPPPPNLPETPAGPRGQSPVDAPPPAATPPLAPAG
jgi:hypothetical protein